ncbi:uncharacterized protein LOC143366236 isoform X1 [Andrena cerasifolii]|uniref:uncharacterized protein LOC143366236 isoform X1 n=1 Tax=Andrena cerasifolii TaxID=2819439 RepID=UPI004037E24D
MDYPDDEEFGISYLKTIWTIVISIGWYLIAIAISFWYASPYIWAKYTKWKLRKDDQDYAAKYHKNSDLLQERISALEASRQNMQEEYYRKCMLVREAEAEAEEKRKGASGLMRANLMGRTLGDDTSDPFGLTEKKAKSTRGEYNPLMGDGSRGYRPPKRTCCGKGGCG